MRLYIVLLRYTTMTSYLLFLLVKDCGAHGSQKKFTLATKKSKSSLFMQILDLFQ